MPGIKFNESLKGITRVLTLLLTDTMALYLAFFISIRIRVDILPGLFGFFPADIPLTHMANLWWMLIICLGCLTYGGLYSKRLPFWPETRNVFISLTLAFILIMAVVSLGKLSGYISRTGVVTSYILSLMTVPLLRYGVKTVLYNMGPGRERVLIIGLNPTGKQIAAAIKRDKYLGYELEGFLTIEGEEKNSLSTEHMQLGPYEEARNILKTRQIKHIIIAAPHLTGAKTVQISNELQPYTRSVMVVPDLFGLPIINGETGYFFDEQILALSIKNNLASPLNMISKRIFDLIISVLLLAPLLIVILILALVIKIDSSGPVFYTGERIGRGGKPFKCYKFRTMFIDNDQILQEHLKKEPEARAEWQQFKKIKGHDPRITRSGSFLRKTSLDELPQIINVFRGEMSLVGARPYLPEEKKDMEGFADTILLADPGITGLWQVSGRSEIDFDGRLRMETWYVRNWSLWLDISLLFRTFGVLLSSKGAY